MMWLLLLNFGLGLALLDAPSDFGSALHLVNTSAALEERIPSFGEAWTKLFDHPCLFENSIACQCDKCDGLTCTDIRCDPGDKDKDCGWADSEHYKECENTRGSCKNQCDSKKHCWTEHKTRKTYHYNRRRRWGGSVSVHEHHYEERKCRRGTEYWGCRKDCGTSFASCILEPSACAVAKGAAQAAYGSCVILAHGNCVASPDTIKDAIVKLTELMIVGVTFTTTAGTLVVINHGGSIWKWIKTVLIYMYDMTDLMVSSFVYTNKLGFELSFYAIPKFLMFFATLFKSYAEGFLNCFFMPPVWSITANSFITGLHLSADGAGWVGGQLLDLSPKLVTYAFQYLIEGKMPWSRIKKDHEHLTNIKWWWGNKEEIGDNALSFTIWGAQLSQEMAVFASSMAIGVPAYCIYQGLQAMGRYATSDDVRQAALDIIGKTISTAFTIVITWAGTAGAMFKRTGDFLEDMYDFYKDFSEWWNTAQTAVWVRQLWECSNELQPILEKWIADPEGELRNYLGYLSPSSGGNPVDWTHFSKTEVKMAIKMADNVYWDGFDIWETVARVTVIGSDIYPLGGWWDGNRPMCFHQESASSTTFSQHTVDRKDCAEEGVGTIFDESGDVVQDLVAYQGRIKKCTQVKLMGDEPVEVCFDVDIYFDSESSSVCWAVYRGSDDTGDWALNMNLEYTDFEEWWKPDVFGFSVWRGFDDGYQYIRSYVNEACAGKEVIAVGHSLGGAFAQLANIYGDAAKSIALGSPRVVRPTMEGHCSLAATDYSRNDENGVRVGLPGPSLHIYISNRYNPSKNPDEDLPNAGFDPVVVVPMLGIHCSQQSIEFGRDEDGTWVNQDYGNPQVRNANAPPVFDDCGAQAAAKTILGITHGLQNVFDKPESFFKGAFLLFMPDIGRVGLHRMLTGFFPVMFSKDFMAHGRFQVGR